MLEKISDFLWNLFVGAVVIGLIGGGIFLFIYLGTIGFFAFVILAALLVLFTWGIGRTVDELLK